MLANVPLGFKINDVTCWRIFIQLIYSYHFHLSSLGVFMAKHPNLYFCSIVENTVLQSSHINKILKSQKEFPFIVLIRLELIPDVIGWGKDFSLDSLPVLYSAYTEKQTSILSHLWLINKHKLTRMLTCIFETLGRHQSTCNVLWKPRANQRVWIRNLLAVR